MTVASSPSARVAYWREVEQLVEQAVALDGQPRREFLARLDEERRRDVNAWLAAMRTDSRLGSTLDRLARDETRREGSGFAPLSPGDRVGSYSVAELLGEGGMGSVYRAHRAEGDFEHQVAVKILRREMQGSHLAQVFAREREILASLNHPHIARLYDGGSTADGLPYFVLELIEDARPITAFCDAERLGIAARVEALLQACDAVQAAHRNLVIHRDIKPSNVLVDGDGSIKLVDFGIAQLLGPDNDPVAPADDGPLMTPHSASPEQLAGRAVGTTSDVYQLGLLLFELLCGVYPHRRVGGAVDLLRDVLSDAEPPRPSEVIRDLAASDLEKIARVLEGRGLTAPEPLVRSLRGDIDAIVVKALRKQPEARYASVAELAADLERWLRGEPVAARAGGAGYRLRKWAGRNRLPAAASILALVSLLTTVILSLSYAASTRRLAAEVERERDLAHEVRGLMTELFEATSPVRSEDMRQPVTAVEILDRGAERVRERLGGKRPDLLAEMLRALARSNQRLGRYEQARELLEEVLELDLAVQGGVHLGVALDNLQLAELEFDQYNFAQGGERVAAAAAVLEALDAPARERVAQAEAYLLFSSIMAAPGEGASGGSQQLADLERAAAAAGEETFHPSKLAMAYRKLGELERAIQLYQRRLAHEEALNPRS